MYSLDSIDVRRYHLFKEASLPFRQGITMIGGRNTSGKSLLSGVIPTMLSLVYGKDAYEAPPKASYVNFKYHNNKTAIEYAITTNASAKYAIGIDGQDMQPHKKSDAAKILHDNWRIPQALSEATIFLKDRGIHPLARGTAGYRSTWLSEALDLTGVYDALKAEVDDKISELARAVDKKHTLEEERDKIMSRIPDSKISKAKALKAKRLLKKYRKVMRLLPNEKQTIENTLKIIEHLEGIPSVSKSADFYEKKVEESRKILARLSVDLEKIEEFEDNRQRNAKTRAKMDKLSKLFDTTMPDKAYHKLLKKIEEATNEVELYVSQKEAYEEQTDARNSLADFKDVEILTHNLEEAENLLSALVYNSAQKEELLESLKSLSSNTKECPTCGNALTKEHRRKEIQRLEADLASLPKEIKDSRAEVRYWKLKATKFVKKPNKPSFTSKDLANWEEQAEAFTEYHALKASLLPENKITSAKQLKSDCKEAQFNVNKYEKQRKYATERAAYITMLPEDMRSIPQDQLLLHAEVMKDRLSVIKSELQHANEVVSRYGEIEIQYETQQKLIANHRSIVKRLDAEIAEIGEEVQDVPAWKALATAFSNSGVRLYQLRESAAVLSSKLTELSSLFFDTTYHFRIEVAPGKLNVLIERNGKVGSVQTLSGSEARSWNLLCAMALIRILPSSLRCDTIFLDEIEANMDDRSRSRYVKDVLPELKTVISKIIVVTPLIKGELALTPNYDYRIVKDRKNGEWISRLIEN